MDKWLFLDAPYDIILRYNTVIKGIEYYYSGSTFKSVLVRFWHTMKRSAALTLAHKFKKKSANWAFSKFGKELTVISPKNGKAIKLLIPVSSKLEFKIGDLSYMLVIPLGAPVPITLNAVCSVEELDCAIPNCTLKANVWHNIRHRKCIKGFESKRCISSYFVKQIALCKSHKNLIYVGKYDGPSLRKLFSYTLSNFD